MPDTGGMAPSIVMTTTDGVVKRITYQPGQSILKAAAVSGMILPSLCWAGACGTCLATVTKGEYGRGPCSPDAMGPMAGEGAVLLCRTFPEGDVEVDLPYDANRIVDTAPAVRQATITALDTVGRDVVRIRMRFAADEEHGSAAEFDPGQFVQLRIPGREEYRAYSLANVGNWDGELEFFVHELADGLFSRWLRESAAVGDVLTVRGPQGAFGLKERGLRPRWFVAGGTGLAPLLSMVRRMIEWGDPQPVRMYVGITTADDVFATEELDAVLAALPEAVITTCVWKPEGELPEPGGPGRRIVAGTTADAVVADLADAAETPDIYVCGPPGMVQALEFALAEAGVDPSYVQTERFTEN